MVAVTADVATRLLSRRSSDDDETLGVVLAGQRRSLAQEATDDELHDDLEAVLGEHAHPTPAEIVATVRRFREATTLVEFVPHILRPYPLDEIQCLIQVSAEHPRPDGAHGHLRRFPLAVLTPLDPMGDDGW
ncbi:hypothetical protein [Streptomyces sp. NPDC002553]|uniref:hypothetical protein n=1 Tax=Streptomyces sp. NPDC002553 TaxID=3154417 RepID=UPI00332E3E58